MGTSWNVYVMYVYVYEYVELEEAVQKLFKGVISKIFKQYKWRKPESREKFNNICDIQDQWLKTGKESACPPNALNLSTRIQADPGYRLSSYV